MFVLGINTKTLPWIIIHSSEICGPRNSIIILAIDYTIWNTRLMGLEELRLHFILSSQITRKRYTGTTVTLLHCKNRYIEPGSDCVILPVSTTPRICECYSGKYSGMNMERHHRNLLKSTSHRTRIVLMRRMSGGGGQGLFPHKTNNEFYDWA